VSDFGTHCYASPNAIVTSFGKGPLLIRHEGREWRFDHSDMFGPLLLTKTGEVAQRQPDKEDHPFWVPFSLWLRSGKRHRPVKTKRGLVRFYLCHLPKPTT
jgi:hypothetical protein